MTAPVEPGLARKREPGSRSTWSCRDDRAGVRARSVRIYASRDGITRPTTAFFRGRAADGRAPASKPRPQTRAQHYGSRLRCPPNEDERPKGEKGAITPSFAGPDEAHVRTLSDEDGEAIGRTALARARFDVVTRANAVLVDRGITRARAG
ncbi:MAG: hypothetical protein AVDCRST_MAG19-428 [uncultured Thermomicrobiales bacterium]|uniref:Uncharacterized protein n=1 Tax=uncultured Thermomicrobiales bacterium TaxID=1645740 RepID=A0A6J4UE86_9BACT|nr:MAG: hypothetical protein AVDCRST_MAG19-428 [uncultured Thermomicrobiales bacterium]